jgi:hypothetical protein
MLKHIKLIGKVPQFTAVTAKDYVYAPEKPVKRRRANQRQAESIEELDDSFEPFGISEDET